MTLAITLVATAAEPDVADSLVIGVAGAPHQLDEVGIVFGDAFGMNEGGVDRLIELAAEELDETCRTLTAKTAVVEIGTFGRCSTAHHDLVQHKPLIEE